MVDTLYAKRIFTRCWKPSVPLMVTKLASWQLLIFRGVDVSWYVVMMFRHGNEQDQATQTITSVNTLRSRQNGRHFADDLFKYIFLNENMWISIKISLKFVPKVPINNISVLVQVMAWRRSGDKPLSEPMLVCCTDAYMRHSASMS